MSEKTVPCLTRPSEKLVGVIPKNKDKKVRFTDPDTSSCNTQKHVDSHKPKDSNQPLLHSTRVIGSTGASGSKPTSNTKHNRILQSSSSNKTNKVEDQSRSVKSMKNKKNRVAKTECNAYIMQSMLNVNSKPICDICNECLFDVNHDKCGLDYVHDIENVTIFRVYYVEGLRHNLFSVGQFYDSDLEVAFRKDTCFICNLEGVDLLTGSRETNLYTLSIGDMMKSSPIIVLCQRLLRLSLCPSPCVDHPFLEVDAPVPAVSTGQTGTVVDPRNPIRVYKLKKALYGLKQAPRAIMNQEQTRQVAACDEKWVPTKERFKISTTNVRLETMPQKEETFQVIIDVIKNSTCYKAFTISVEVSEIFVHIFVQFQGVDFAEVPDDEATLTFLLSLGYKGPLHKHPSMKRISDKRTKNQAKNNKTEHGMEKRGKDKVKSKQTQDEVKSAPQSQQSKPEPIPKNT
ncbi:hypothetical protein Tco_0770722 [Tanacetum coccineum]|uniref:Uncharacterized protein n=1 Tax=Tanacetum coccineum TaxID=301880 RepID=A0ABQ4ZEC1_9ASTR